MRNFKFRIIYVSNIPNDYHAKDLRRFFQIFTEWEKFKLFHFRQRPEILNFNGNLTGINFKPKRSDHKSLCAFCVVNSKYVDELINYYHDKHWLQKNSNEPLPDKCKIILSDNFDDISRDLIVKIIELNPPNDMPQGNVGTPLKFFFDLNIKCKLSLKVIRKLGLDFNASYKLNTYCSISYDYKNPKKPIKNNTIAHSYQLMNDDEYDIYKMTKEIEKKHRFDPIENMEESVDFTATQDDEMEEWERFEFLHDDPHDLNKSSRCMLEYEREEETVWEKGGPGMVMYTDQAFWKDEENRDIDDFFDEAGNWDFDYETSDHLKEAIYHRKMVKTIENMQKPIKDTRQMKSNNALAPSSISSTAIKMMKKSGWNIGQSLGTDGNRGIKTFSEINPSQYILTREAREGLHYSNNLGPISDSSISVSSFVTYYGQDKNIRSSYFVRFIKCKTDFKL